MATLPRVLGTARKFSDLDLCLRGDACIPGGILSAIQDALEESDLPYRVDVIDWHANSPSFRQAIEGDLEDMDQETTRQPT